MLAGGFAIFAGFIIFLAFTSYDQSRTGGETEALTVIQQFETAEFYRRRCTCASQELVCYARSVVYQEWPQMEEGKGGDTINPWGAALFKSLRLAKPTSPTEQSAFDKWLDQTSTARRPGATGSTVRRGIIPSSIWLVSSW